MVIQSPAVFLAVTGASAIGLITVSSTADVYPGAVGWIGKDDGSASALVKVLSIVSSTTFYVRRFKGDVESATPQYGRSDLSGFATGSHLNLESQLVPVNPASAKRDQP